MFAQPTPAAARSHAAAGSSADTNAAPPPFLPLCLQRSALFARSAGATPCCRKIWMEKRHRRVEKIVSTPERGAMTAVASPPPPRPQQHSLCPAAPNALPVRRLHSSVRPCFNACSRPASQLTRQPRSPCRPGSRTEAKNSATEKKMAIEYAAVAPCFAVYRRNGTGSSPAR